MRVLIVGAGPVGLVTAACLAEAGNSVHIYDCIGEKIEKIKTGRAPLFEKGLDDLLGRALESGKLFPISNLEEGFAKSDIIMLCVGTPPKENGEIDLSQLQGACMEIANVIGKGGSRKLVVVKSTVVPGTAKELMRMMECATAGNDFGIAVNPEFLRQGNAVADFADSPIIIASENERDIESLRELYRTIGREATVLPVESAEMSKYVSNCFNATKVSFINEMGLVCKQFGIDVNGITDALGYSGMAGRYMKAGHGFGGSCLEKDLRAFVSLGAKQGVETPVLNSVLEVNRRMDNIVISTLEKRLGGLEGRRIGILGLSYKKGTDDVRNSRAIGIIRSLIEKKAELAASDPRAMGNMRPIFPGIAYFENPQEVIERSEALAVLTDWDEFSPLEFRDRIVVDGRSASGKRGKNHEGICRP
jgi:UDPglucose 6-dehydrogenase